MNNPPKGKDPQVVLPGGSIISAYGYSVEADPQGNAHHTAFTGNGAEHVSYDTRPDDSVIPGSAHYTPPNPSPTSQIIQIDLAGFDPN